MSVKQYSTDEKCPNCGVNILQELCDHVYSEGGKDFEYECPSCGHGLEITVEPVPAFSISLVKVEPTVPGTSKTLTELGIDKDKIPF